MKIRGTGRTPAAHDARLEQLRKGRWFADLPHELQERIVQRSVVRTYRKGDVIVRQGEPTKGMFCVLEGRVRAVNFVRDDEEVLLDIGEVGYWFAVYGMLARSASIGSVVADTGVVALNLPQREFVRIVDEEPRYYPFFARLLIEQFALVFRSLGEMLGLGPEEWLLNRLQGLVATRRREHAAHVAADEIVVSQADLAAMIGVSRQTLSVLLGRLESRGLVKVGYRSVQLLA